MEAVGSKRGLPLLEVNMEWQRKRIQKGQILLLVTSMYYSPKQKSKYAKTGSSGGFILMLGMSVLLLTSQSYF